MYIISYYSVEQYMKILPDRSSIMITSYCKVRIQWNNSNNPYIESSYIASDDGIMT